MENRRLLFPSEVADILRVKENTVRAWLRNGEMEGIKLGGKLWRVHPESVVTFMEANSCQKER